MNIEELTNNTNYSFHHTSWARGYVSRRGGAWIEEYSGRFGNGYKLHHPSWQSTTYHHVTYYIENK